MSGKSIWLVIFVVIAAIGGYLWWSGSGPAAPTRPPEATDTATTDSDTPVLGKGDTQVRPPTIQVPGARQTQSPDAQLGATPPGLTPPGFAVPGAPPDNFNPPPPEEYRPPDPPPSSFDPIPPPQNFENPDFVQPPPPPPNFDNDQVPFDDEPPQNPNPGFAQPPPNGEEAVQPGDD